MTTSRSSSGPGASLFRLAGAALLVLLVGYPLLSLLLQAVMPKLFGLHMSMVPSLAPVVGVFTDRNNLAAVVNSVLLGLEGTAAAVIVGTFTAFAVESMTGFRRTLLDGMVWLVFFKPSYIIAQGWVMFMQGGGILAQLLHLPMGWSSWFFGPIGVVVIYGFSFFPFVHFSMQLGIRNVNGDLVKAARLAGASRYEVFHRILLPLLTPSLLAGASIAFAEVFGDFGVPLAVSTQTHLSLLPFQIYTRLNESPVNFSAAAWLALLVLVVSAGAIFLQFFWMRNRDYSTVSSRSAPVPVEKKRSRLVGALAVMVFFFALVVPLGSILTASLWKVWANGLGAGNWTLLHYGQALTTGGRSLQALGLSLTYALITAVVTMILGVVLAYEMSFQKSAVTSFLNILTMSTIAVPGIVLAVSYIFAWNAVWLIPLNLVLYGTPFALGLAYLATYLPYAIRLQLGSMAQLPPSLVKAARVAGAGNAAVVRKIVLPLVAGTAIATFFMTFSKVIFELPAATLLYAPGDPTFSVIIQHTFNEFDWSKGSALSILALILVFGTYALGRHFVKSWNQDSGDRLEVSAEAPPAQEPGLVGRRRVTT